MKLYHSPPDTESVELDSIDLGILDLLQDNCKQPLAQIGEKVGLKAPSVLERIDEQYGIDLRALVDRRLTARGLPPRHPGFERELAGDDGAGGGGRGFAATVSSQQRSLEDQSLALAEQQRAITTQTEAVRRLQDTIRRLEEAVVSQQRTVEAQQENLAGAREELARRVDELRAEWKRADGAEAAARSAAATVEELRRRLEERSRELDESRRRAGELTAVLESRRHRLVEGPYRWLKRRPRLFSLFKWSWRGALKASGRR